MTSSLGLKEALAQREQAVWASDWRHASACVTARGLSLAMTEMLADHAKQTGLGSVPGVAVLALGALSRWERCPRSDVDVVVVHTGKPPSREQLDAFLYPLWNAGFELGHAVRSVEDTAALCAIDHAALTAHFSPVCIAGDSVVLQRLQSLYESRLTAACRKFVVEVTAPRAQRSLLESEVCVLEPDVKNGAGGLRELQQLRFVAGFATGHTNLRELQQAEWLSDDEWRRLQAALQCFLRTRLELHSLTKRRQDKLIFELQPEVARSMYGDRYTGRLLVEHLLTRHFRHARDVVDIGRRFYARVRDSLPGASGKTPPERQSLFVAQASSSLDAKQLLEMVDAALTRDRELDDATLDAMHSLAASLDVPATARSDWHAAFLRVIRHPHGDRAFYDLHQTGVLARLVPEFAAATRRVVADFYHTFTVDVHTLHVLAALYRLRRGEGDPHFSKLVKHEEAFTSLVFGCFFHDAGKGSGRDHSEVGAELVERVMTRLGCSFDDIEDAQFLIREHLSMMKISQRRDLSDDGLILDFAAKVRDSGRLRRLYALSYVDTKETGPTLWTEWKAALLKELYERTEAALQQPSWQSPTARYERLFTPDERACFAQLVKNGGGVVRGEALHGFSSLLLASRDRPGLLARIARVCAQHRVSIQSADLALLPNGFATDRFIIKERDAADESAWQKLEAAITAALNDTSTLESAGLDHSWRRPMLLPDVSVTLMETSSLGQVIEVIAADRPGLLAQLAHVIFANGYSINAARIATEAVRAIDTFYVTQVSGQVSLSELQQALHLGASHD